MVAELVEARCTSYCKCVISHCNPLSDSEGVQISPQARWPPRHDGSARVIPSDSVTPMSSPAIARDLCGWFIVIVIIAIPTKAGEAISLFAQYGIASSSRVIRDSPVRDEVGTPRNDGGARVIVIPTKSRRSREIGKGN